MMNVIVSRLYLRAPAQLTPNCLGDRVHQRRLAAALRRAGRDPPADPERANERLGRTYDDLTLGLSRYIRDAIVANCQRAADGQDDEQANAVMEAP